MLLLPLLLLLLPQTIRLVNGDAATIDHAVLPPTTLPPIDESEPAPVSSTAELAPIATDTTATTAPTDTLPTSTWLQEMSTFPQSYSFRNEVYNRPFRYRGKLTNRQDAYNLWFDCLKALRAPALEEGPMLTKEGHAYCHRLGHRITKEQRARLNPVQPKAYTVERIPVPSRDSFLEQYSLLARPVIMKELSTSMMPTKMEEMEQHATPPPTIASCLSNHAHVQSFPLPLLCGTAMVHHYFIPSFMVNDVIQSIRDKMNGIADEAPLNTPEWPIVWQTTPQDHRLSMPLTQAPHGAHIIHAVVQGTIRVRLYAPQEHHKLHPQVHEGGHRSYTTDQHPDQDTYMYKTIVVTAPNALFVPSGFVYEWNVENNQDDSPVVVVSHGFVDAGALNHFKDEGELDWNHPSMTSSLLLVPPSKDMHFIPSTPSTLPTAPTPPTTYTRTARVLSAMHGKNVPFPRSVPQPMFGWLDYKHQRSTTATNTDQTKSTKSTQSTAPTETPSKPKKKQYREWRMQKNWETKMLGLIPATPTIEQIVYVGWEYIKLKVSLPYGQDSTFHSTHQGFMMTWSLMNNYTSMEHQNSTGSHKMTMENHCQKETRNIEKEPELRLPPVSHYVCSCNVLLPSAHYAIRLASLTSTSVGSSSSAIAATMQTLSVPPTLATPTFCGIKFVVYRLANGTQSNTPEICISVRAPNDSGGRPITAVVYRWKRAGRYHTFTQTPWRFSVTKNDIELVNNVPPLLKRTLHNVLPDAAIEVQVAMENKLGRGEWSQHVSINTTLPRHSWSESIIVHETSVSPDFVDVEETALEMLPLHVQERRRLNQQQNQQNQQNQQINNAASDTGLAKKIGVLSTKGHTLNIVQNDGTTTMDMVIQGWRLHHAPISHDVRAGLIIADPMDASEEQFYNDIQGKIVLIERGGGVPFRDKVRRAQLAGALGVVLMDNTGKCTDAWHQGCVPGGSKHNGEGFAKEDKVSSWEGIDTPTLMITKKDAETIKLFVGAPLM